MKNRLIVAGFGGQGVMMIGQLLCYAAVEHGKEALFLPQYGPEQRGGTANCFVILSEDPIGSPTSIEIDTLIAMNEPSLNKFQGQVKDGGDIFINSSLIDSKAVRKGVKIYALPVDELAVELGSQKVANIIMLSACVKYCKFFTKKQLMDTVCSKLAKKPQFLEMNKNAVRIGMDSSKVTKA